MSNITNMSISDLPDAADIMERVIEDAPKSAQWGRGNREQQVLTWHLPAYRMKLTRPLVPTIRMAIVDNNAMTRDLPNFVVDRTVFPEGETVYRPEGARGDKGYFNNVLENVCFDLQGHADGPHFRGDQTSWLQGCAVKNVPNGLHALHLWNASRTSVLQCNFRGHEESAGYRGTGVRCYKSRALFQGNSYHRFRVGVLHDGSDGCTHVADEFEHCELPVFGSSARALEIHNNRYGSPGEFAYHFEDVRGWVHSGNVSQSQKPVVSGKVGFTNRGKYYAEVVPITSKKDSPPTYFSHANQAPKVVNPLSQED